MRALTSRGSDISGWIVEEQVGERVWRCHRRDSPFRKAILRLVRGSDLPTLEREARALAHLQHPNIAPVLGLETSGEELYLVSEVVPGTPLDAFLTGAAGTLPRATALEIALQLVDAVATAHASGVVHGDLRPGNVVLGPDGRLRLTGFELSASLDREPPDPSRAAPELASGGTPSAASDRYALGVLLVELLGGRGALDDGFPAPLRKAVGALLAPDPKDRARLGDVRFALDGARVVRPPGATPPPDRSWAGKSFSASWGEGSGEPTLAVGTAPTRIGRYDVVREIGRGGAGVVYEALDSELHRKVAVKVLLSGSFARAREVQRFKQEAQAVARLDHEGIVAVLDIGSDADGAWFAMEYVDGISLMERIRRDGKLPWIEAVAIAAKLARALDHAHRAGLLHRDVKPHNVLLEGGTRPKLADFGLALDTDADATRLTGTGQILGTPTYMAPEQAMGDLKALGPRTDVYALGVLLYEAVTGAVPFDGSAPLQVIGRILRGNPRSPREVEGSVPKAVDTVILKAMRLDPADRYPTAVALAEDLERCLRGEPVLASAPTVLERGRWYVRAHAAQLGLSSAVLLAAFVAVLGVYGVARWQAGRARAERERVADEAWASVEPRLDAARAQGDDDAAEELFRAFVARPEHGGTRALARAWWDRADATSGADRISALASAYGAAARPDDQAESLARLAGAAREERRFDLLMSVADTLARRDPERASDPALRALRRDALAAHRRFADAAAADPDPTSGPARALRALAPATRTERRGTAIQAFPGGGAWVWDRFDQTSELVATVPSLDLVRPLPLPFELNQPGVPFEVDGRAYALAHRLFGGTELLRLDDAGFALEQHLSDLPLGPAVAADLDGDGAIELWFGEVRSLARATRGPGGWVLDRPSSETEASNSVIAGVELFPDSGGGTTLAVAASEWSAYDVRLLRPGSWAVGSRVKLGTVEFMERATRPDGRASLLVCKSDAYPNARVFPPDRLSGAPQGLWEVTPGEAGLEARQVFPVPCAEDLAVGDFDGDGLQDAAYTVGLSVLILVRRPDGGFDDVWASGIQLAGALQADDDPATELVVSDPGDDRRLWVIGAGTEVLPATAPPHPDPAEPPEGADAAFRQAWDRAGDLVWIGQLGEAADALRELSTVRFGSPEATAALLRAAELRSRNGDHALAAELYREADRAGAPDALRRVASSFRAAGDDRRQLAALLELEARGPLADEDRAALEALRPLASAPTFVATFDGALDPRWEVLDPFAVHRDRARSVLAVQGSGQQVLARLPVVWDGRWLGVEVELDVDRTEWGGMLAVGLVPRGTDGEGVAGVRVTASGGGEIVQRGLDCRTLDATVPGHFVPDTAGARATLAVFFQPDGARWCDLSSAGEVVHERYVDPAKARADGGWDLVLRESGEPSGFTSVSVRRIALLGATVDPDAPARTGPAWALADGDPSAVGPADPPLLRAAAAADRGDARALVEALAALGRQRPTALAHLLHPRLDLAAGTTRELLGADWYVELARAWEVVLVTHPRADDGLATALLKHLDGVDQAEPRSAAERDALALLLVRRGAVATARKLDAVGRASLERGLALADDPRWGPVEDVPFRTMVNVARVDLAELAARAGDPDAAFALLDEAVARAPSPLVIADVIAARQGLSPLHADPRWARFAASGPVFSPPAPAPAPAPR